MHEQDNVVPITRGKPSRLQLTLTSHATGVTVQLERMKTDAVGQSRSRSASQPHAPATVLEFKPRPQEGQSKVNRYEISEDNHVHAIGSTETGGAVVAGEQELEQLAANWPMRRLVEVWNQLPGVRPVARFENRSVAVRRICQALQEPNERRGGWTTKDSRPKRETKLQLILRMLRTPQGATLRALMKVTRWQAHSVRGFLSGKVSKQLGLPLESFKRDGERVYRLPTEP